MARPFCLFVGVVVEVTLDIDDGGALVAGAGGQVAQRANQVGEPTGSGTLGYHVAHQAGAVLLLNLLLDGIPESLAGEGGEVVVRQILELQLVGRALQTCGVGRGDNRVSQLPDLAHGVLEGAVAVYHHFHMLAGELQQLCLNVLHQVLFSM